MKYASGPLGKRFFFDKRFRRFAFATGLLLSLAVALFWPGFFPFPHASAASHVSFARTVTMSPSSGPVGTVIAVSVSGVTYPDGTKVDLGYTTNFSTCFVAPEEQTSAVSGQAFSGWMRWPASTGTGNFGACVVVTSFNSFLLGMFNVLSASAPQVTVNPSAPDAAHQVTVTGANFLPGGVKVNLVWQSANAGQTLALGSATSDNTGAFTQTFMVPANSSTGSYSISATFGTNQPPTLSAEVTFHVTGITIAPVSTPGAVASPTAAPTTAATSPTAVAISTPAASSAGGGSTSNPAMGGNTSTLLLLLILAGLLLILVALVAGVLIVRRQRNVVPGVESLETAEFKALGSGQAFLQVPEYATANMPPLPLPPPGPPRFERMLQPPVTAPVPRVEGPSGTLPFDADLAEAMRLAQVSLFAMPRPPVGQEVLS